jgi:hypothetical protein
MPKIMKSKKEICVAHMCSGMNTWKPKSNFGFTILGKDLQFDFDFWHGSFAKKNKREKRN